MDRIKLFRKNAFKFDNPEMFKLNKICLRNYIWNHLILQKKSWKLKFKGKKIPGSTVRITNAPNEFYLYHIMDLVGLKILDEKLLPVDTIYIISV